MGAVDRDVGAANLETRLGEEAGSSSVGYLLPVPADGGDGSDSDPLAGLKADIANLRGRHALVETTAAGWGEGRTAAPQSDYKPQRVGAHPPGIAPHAAHGRQHGHFERVRGPGKPGHRCRRDIAA